jgi:predicted DNA-binding transcriptional regulator YafY
MDRAAWHRPVDAASAAARAGGRRRFNAGRQARAAERRAQVMQLVYEVRLAASGRSLWGLQAVLAERFGVSPATISRDLARSRLRALRSTTCEACGQRVLHQ